MEENRKIITNIIQKLGLYDEIDLSNWDLEKQIDIIGNLDNLENSIDLYCPSCEKETPFTNSFNADLSGISSRIGQIRNKIKEYPKQIERIKNQIDIVKDQQKKNLEQNLLRYEEDFPNLKDEEKDLLLKDRFFSLELNCTRNNSHKVIFIFKKSGLCLQKIGQFPSIKDLKKYKIKKYRTLLNKKYNELSTSLGLFSHGVGIGSFVYLRRIFEFLLEEAHSKAKNNNNWNESTYVQGRISDKIVILKEYLPEFLVENSEIYSILSDGVHNLSDSECLSNFDIVYTAIELILEEQLSKQNFENKKNKAREAIRKMNNKKT